jgi:tetratricopeptide (TPR) repeat protein
MERTDFSLTLSSEKLSSPPPAHAATPSGQDYRAFVGAARERVRQVLIDMRATAAGACEFAGATGDYERALEVARQNKDQEMSYSYIDIIPIYGQLGRKQEALEAWHTLLKEYPGTSAASFESWWRLWNIPEPDIAKLMGGVYKSGVLGAEVGLGQ